MHLGTATSTDIKASDSARNVRHLQVGQGTSPSSSEARYYLQNAASHSNSKRRSSSTETESCEENPNRALPGLLEAKSGSTSRVIVTHTKGSDRNEWSSPNIGGLNVNASTEHPDRSRNPSYGGLELRLGVDRTESTTINPNPNREYERTKAIRKGPEWLSLFLSADYFSHCQVHDADMNYFCISCNGGLICQRGLRRDHDGHNTLQVRRASNANSIKDVDIKQHVDISGIQLYSINSANIVFLCRRLSGSSKTISDNHYHQHHQRLKHNAGSNAHSDSQINQFYHHRYHRTVEGTLTSTGKYVCITCARSLPDARSLSDSHMAKFCSLECKLLCVRDDLDTISSLSLPFDLNPGPDPNADTDLSLTSTASPTALPVQIHISCKAVSGNEDGEPRLVRKRRAVAVAAQDGVAANNATIASSRRRRTAAQGTLATFTQDNISRSSSNPDQVVSPLERNINKLHNNSPQRPAAVISGPDDITANIQRLTEVPVGASKFDASSGSGIEIKKKISDRRKGQPNRAPFV